MVLLNYKSKGGVPVRKCESCGKTFIESKDVFCPHCGAVATSKRVCECDNTMDTSRFYREGNYNTKQHFEHDDHNERPSTSFAAGESLKKFTSTLKTDVRPAGRKAAAPQKSAVIFVLILFAVFFIGMITSLVNEFGTDYNYDDDYYDDYGYYDDDYYYYDDEYGTDVKCGGAEVEMLNGNATLKITLSDMADFTNTETYGRILNGELDFFNIELYEVREDTTFADLEYPDFTNVASTALSDDSAQLLFPCEELSAGKIYYVTNLSAYLQNGEYCRFLLPFAAFGFADDGTVTLYDVEMNKENIRMPQFVPITEAVQLAEGEKIA